MCLLNIIEHLLCVKYKENDFFPRKINCDKYNLTIFCSLDDIQNQGFFKKRNKLHFHSNHVSLMTILHEKQV